MRRSTLLRVLCLGVVCLALGACAKQSEPGASSKSPGVFRVVRPKQLTPLSVLEKQGTLEKSLAPLGLKVEWLEFAAGPQQLEALNAGALDIASTAESPPIFAQAAGNSLVYLATTHPSGKAVSLLVKPQAKIETLGDLKGKRVAFQKASIGHYLLVRGLESVGLSLNDVTSVFLPPPDANAAFSEGQVDAWFVWEPFVTRAVQNGSGKVLVDGGQLRDTANFITTRREFLEQHRDALQLFVRDLQAAEAWSTAHPREMTELLAQDLLLDIPTLLEMHAKYDFGILPIDQAVIERQQRVADLWHELGFLPGKVDVRRGFLKPEEYAQLIPTPGAAVR
ncbi:MAG: aliphatic sulfonate ABC transporter substrate-binding protein [Polyangiaceae bacterium]